MLNSSYLLTYLSFPMECVWLGIGGALGPDTGGRWVTGWGWWWLSDWCSHSARVGEWLLRFLVRQIHIQVLGIFYSRMRSKGFRFTLGVWGLRVRNRSRDPRMAVPMGSSAEVIIFGGVRRDIQTYSGPCRKSFCVTGAIVLRHFQKIFCSFRSRRNTLDVSIVIFRGRRSTLDVSCCVFFVNRIGRAAPNGDKVQIPWQTWHFL